MGGDDWHPFPIQNKDGCSTTTARGPGYFFRYLYSGAGGTGVPVMLGSLRAGLACRTPTHVPVHEFRLFKKVARPVECQPFVSATGTVRALSNISSKRGLFIASSSIFVLEHCVNAIVVLAKEYYHPSKWAGSSDAVEAIRWVGLDA